MGREEGLDESEGEEGRGKRRRRRKMNVKGEFESRGWRKLESVGGEAGFSPAQEVAARDVVVLIDFSWWMSTF